MNKIIGSTIFLMIYLFSLGTSFSQDNFKQFIENIQKEPFFRHASLGVSVRNVNDFVVLGGVSNHKTFIPASSLKLITTLCAFSILGKDFAYETQILHSGTIENGILKGDIIIRGSGDPTLGSDRWNGKTNVEKILSQIVLSVQQAGIKSIEGNIISDISTFDVFPLAASWQWNDIGNYYAGGAWGLNVLENEYSVFFQRDLSIGSKAPLVMIEPFIPQLEIENFVTVAPAGTGDNVYIYEGPKHFSKKALGTVPQGKNTFRIRGAIPDPPLYFAYRVHKKLSSFGIISLGYTTSQTKLREQNEEKLMVINSPNLQQIIKEANSYSINLYCDALLRTLSIQDNSQGSYKKGIEVITEFLEKKGLDLTPLLLEDGSGLSARNAVSPDFFTHFLALMMQQFGEKEILFLLPQVGSESTVKNLLAKHPSQSSFWAKTGSMSGIYSLTGFCKTNKDKMVSFSIIINGSTSKDTRANRAEAEKILSAVHKYF
ncbi:MAG: D-alanyl-D-alanine carboxypeptidase/D-alanyl-D-alanine-endopeptidase [Saprospiraceae bacterium]